jgi:hypothetical protein
MPMTADPAVLRDLDTLATVQRQLGEALSRLADVSARSADLIAQTSWRTDAAALYRLAADTWRRDVTASMDEVDDALERVRRARERLESAAETPLW